MRSWARHRHTLTVQIVPYQGDSEDEHGDILKSYGAPSSISGAIFAPGSASEADEATRDNLYEAGRLFLPVGTRIGPYDRVITAQSIEWEVEGEPSIWASNPFTGAPGGIEVQLSRRQG